MSASEEGVPPWTLLIEGGGWKPDAELLGLAAAQLQPALRPGLPVC